MTEDTKFKIGISQHAISTAAECLAWIKGENNTKEDLFALANEIMKWEREEVGKWIKDEASKA
jgi:hypothetical protein